MAALIEQQRRKLHEKLVNEKIWFVDKDGVPSNADVGDRKKAKLGNYNVSTLIAREMAKAVGIPTMDEEKRKGTGSGNSVEAAVAEFLNGTFPHFQHLRPGTWKVKHVGNNAGKAMQISGFSQYEHLAYLASVVQHDRKIQAALGNGYVIAPDVVICRYPCGDDEINKDMVYVDDRTATMADIRQDGRRLPILHASVSCKWTMRSDRAQNSRTEALSLIRNRKGHLPHIVAVTNEPLPSRIASLALGTGDIDCVYHIALYELQKAVDILAETAGRDDLKEALDDMVTGKRLKDISDLPLDLCV